MKIKTLLFVIVLCVAFSLGFAHTSAESPSLRGVTISPAFQMVTIADDATQQPVSFKITNNRSTAENLSLSAADFNSLNESGGLFFVGTNPTALQKKYGLAKWFSLPQKTLIIQPHQTQTINAQILNLPDLAAGGHYGALMISLNDNSKKTGQVGLQPIASSLLFVTKPQGATHKLGLSDVTLNRSLFKLPSKVDLRFHNDGNTHVVPRGTVTLSTSNGQVISRGVINQNSNIILPETYRKYDVTLKNVSSAYIPKRYTLNVSFRFDGIDQFRQYQTSFLYVPMVSLVTIFVLLAALASGYLLYRRR